MRTISRNLLFITLFFKIASATIYADDVYNFDKAYLDDDSWPPFVIPLEDIYDASGKLILNKNIRVVLTRAYKDGMIAVVDRNGTFLIDHSATDFLERTREIMGQDRSKKQGLDLFESGGKNFILQIGRRVFDVDRDSQKAISEAELLNFKEFVICRLETNPQKIQEFRKEMSRHYSSLQEQNIEVIVILDTIMPNQDFYEFLKLQKITYPTVVPVFSKGLVDAVITERESNCKYIRVSISGKVTRCGNSVESLL